MRKLLMWYVPSVRAYAYIRYVRTVSYIGGISTGAGAIDGAHTYTVRGGRAAPTYTVCTYVAPTYTATTYPIYVYIRTCSHSLAVGVL